MTARQEAFAREYLVDLNAAAAARRAGYSPSQSLAAASTLLIIPHIASHVAQLQAARAARRDIKADHVLDRLLDELDADTADLFDADGNLLPVRSWPAVWRRGLVTSIQVTTLYKRDASGAQVEIGNLKNVTFADRVKRLELLGKHVSVQAFREKVQLGLDDPLRMLFEQVRGQAIRPQLTIESTASPTIEQRDEG
jgi:phage terminase small subunit